MNRQVRTKVPMYIPPSTSSSHREAQQNDMAARQKQKEYADKHRRARQQEVKVGDKVLLWQKKTTTKQPYDPDPYKVTQVVGTRVTGERRGKQKIRNIEKWKVIQPRPDHLIPRRRRRTQNTVRQEDSSDSDLDFEIVQWPRQEPRQNEEDADRFERQDEEEANRSEEEVEEIRQRPVRKKRVPERLGAQPQQQRAAGNSPRERKRRQAAASKVSTPRREQRKARTATRGEQPGLMTPTGWRREKWISRGEQGNMGSREEETD